VHRKKGIRNKHRPQNRSIANPRVSTIPNQLLVEVGYQHSFRFYSSYLRF